MSNKFYYDIVEDLDLIIADADRTFYYLSWMPHFQEEVYQDADEIATSNMYCKDEKQLVSEKKLYLQELNKKIKDIVMDYWADKPKLGSEIGRGMCPFEECACNKKKSEKKEK